MSDDCFAIPRLARIYDELEAPRDDLAHYHSIVEEFAAASVLDIGCGTGTFACQLGARGLDVTGVDPAAASLDVARTKVGADRVRWICATATSVPPVGADLATMTGNVAQVFLDDADWDATLAAVGRALNPGGVLVFEVREPQARGWEQWTKLATFEEMDTSAEGRVDYWVELTEIDLPFVSFEQHYLFARDGLHLRSLSTLRFRSRDEIERSLADNGFQMLDLRDAPDRPGLEHVFIARRGRPWPDRSP